MIDPPPAAVIGPVTAFMPSQQPTAFTSRTCRKSASGMSAIRANFSTPALFTSTSSLAEGVQRGGDRGCPLRFAGHVVVHVPAGPLAEPVGDGNAPVVEHVAEDHPRALRHEVPHVRLAHPPGAPGDQCDLAVEPADGPSRSRVWAKGPGI